MNLLASPVATHATHYTTQPHLHLCPSNWLHRSHSQNSPAQGHDRVSSTWTSNSLPGGPTPQVPHRLGLATTLAQLKLKMVVSHEPMWNWMWYCPTNWQQQQKWLRTQEKLEVVLYVSQTNNNDTNSGETRGACMVVFPQTNSNDSVKEEKLRRDNLIAIPTIVELVLTLEFALATPAKLDSINSN